MKEKDSKKIGKSNKYKIGLFVLIGIIVLVGLYFGFTALQNNAFRQGVQEGAVTAESQVVKRITDQGEVPLVVGQGENQTVQWTAMGDICQAMIQRQQQTAQQGTQQISGA